MGENHSYPPFAIVGIGPGDSPYMLPAGVDEISRADLLIGGERHLALFRDYRKETLSLAGKISRLPEMIREHRALQKIVLLVSGDPGYYSLLSLISRNFESAEYRVIPGISSFQLAAARTGLPWQDDLLLSLHGREEADWLIKAQTALHEGRRVFFLTDKQHSPLWIGKNLISAMKNEKQIEKLSSDLFYRLGHEDETRLTISLDELVKQPDKLKEETLCLMIINPA